MLAETVCAGVSAAGLGIAVVNAYRKRYLAAARIGAYALVPVGLAMTGVVGWVVDTAFSPSAWAGFGVLGLSWLLFTTTRGIERRRGGGHKERRAAAGAEHESVAPAASTPSLGPSTRRTDRGATASRGGSQDPDDFSDIEAILKKHGI